MPTAAWPVADGQENVRININGVAESWTGVFLDFPASDFVAESCGAVEFRGFRKGKDVHRAGAELDRVGSLVENGCSACPFREEFDLAGRVF